MQNQSTTNTSTLLLRVALFLSVGGGILLVLIFIGIIIKRISTYYIHCALPYQWITSDMKWDMTNGSDYPNELYERDGYRFLIFKPSNESLIKVNDENDKKNRNQWKKCKLVIYFHGNRSTVRTIHPFLKSQQISDAFIVCVEYLGFYDRDSLSMATHTNHWQCNPICQCSVRCNIIPQYTEINHVDHVYKAVEIAITTVKTLATSMQVNVPDVYIIGYGIGTYMACNIHAKMSTLMRWIPRGVLLHNPYRSVISHKYDNGFPHHWKQRLYNIVDCFDVHTMFGKMTLWNSPWFALSNITNPYENDDISGRNTIEEAKKFIDTNNMHANRILECETMAQITEFYEEFIKQHESPLRREPKIDDFLI